LQCLKLFRVASINAQEMQEIVCNDLPVDIIFWPPFLQNAQRLGEMLVQRDCLMSQLPNEKVLFLDLLLER